jgi:hypothetical protein
LAGGAQKPIQFGSPGDIPVPGDYDGIGRDELAVYRPSTGQFIVLNPVTLQQEIVATLAKNEVPVPAQYAYENTTLPYETEAAVFDPSSGTFTIAPPYPTTGVDETVTFQANDIPVPADYAGTGSIQPAVYRPTTGQFLEKNSAGTGNTVIATFANLAGATVVPVDAPLSYLVPIPITATPGTQLVVTTSPPTTVAAGAGFGLAITVETSKGAVETTFTGTVTLELVTNSGGSILGGTSTASVVNGVATFSGLTLNNPGNGYTLEATVDGLTVSTNSFNVESPTATATQLVVTSPPPATVTAGAGFGLQVSVETSSGVVDNTFTGTVTLELVTNSGGSILGGTTIAPVVNGVATFSGLTLNNPGSGYTLMVSSNGLTSALTTPFNVVPQTPPPPVPPVIIGESALFTRQTNKKGKPVGPPVLTLEFDFSAAMNPVTTNNPANYVIDQIVSKRVKGKPVKVLKPVKILKIVNPSNKSVELLLAGKPTFKTGGEITLVATPPGGISSAAGGQLDGNNRGSGGDNGTFTILVSAKRFKLKRS